MDANKPILELKKKPLPDYVLSAGLISMEIVVVKPSGVGFDQPTYLGLYRSINSVFPLAGLIDGVTISGTWKGPWEFFGKQFIVTPNWTTPPDAPSTSTPYIQQANLAASPGARVLWEWGVENPVYIDVPYMDDNSGNGSGICLWNETADVLNQIIVTTTWLEFLVPPNDY